MNEKKEEVEFNSDKKKQTQPQLQITKDPHDKDPFRKKYKATKLGGEENKKKTPSTANIAERVLLESAINKWRKRVAHKEK